MLHPVTTRNPCSRASNPRHRGTEHAAGDGTRARRLQSGVGATICAPRQGAGRTAGPSCLLAAFTALSSCLPACAPAGPWARQHTDVAPSPRSRFGLAYDSDRRVLVLFGGTLGERASGSHMADDTWEYDGTSWREVTPAVSPCARWNHAMAYDSARRVVVLFGGMADDPLGDTWEYDGRSWREVTPAASPPAGSDFGVAYDAAREVVVLAGWDALWEYDGQTWAQAAFAPAVQRLGREIVYDSARSVVVLAGGEQDAQGASTWEYDGQTWVETVAAEHSAPALAWPGLAYDSGRRRVVLFGGRAGNDVLSAATWEYDGTAWTEVTSERSPRARLSPGLAYDAARGVTMLFGGTGSDGHATVVLNDTWEYRAE